MSDDIMRWFDGSHLPTSETRILAEQHRSLAEQIAVLAPSEERSTALRKLLEAKDAAVRALLLTEEQNVTGLELPPGCPHVHWDEMISGGSRVRMCRDCHESFGWTD